MRVPVRHKTLPSAGAKGRLARQIIQPQNHSHADDRRAQEAILPEQSLRRPKAEWPKQERADGARNTDTPGKGPRFIPHRHQGPVRAGNALKHETPLLVKSNGVSDNINGLRRYATVV
jgi:hypothetical protein